MNMKEYEVTVYRTVQQSATVTIESDRELTTSEIEYIRNKAEDETSKLSDYDWKDEEVDDKVDVTIYDGNTYYLTQRNKTVTKSIKQIREDLRKSNDTHLQNMEKVLNDEQISLLVNAINNYRQMKLLEEE